MTLAYFLKVKILNVNISKMQELEPEKSREITLNVRYYNNILMAGFQANTSQLFCFTLLNFPHQSGVWGQYKFIMFNTILIPFPPFPGGVKNTYSQFSRKLVNKIQDLFADYDQGTPVL